MTLYAFFCDQTQTQIWKDSSCLDDIPETDESWGETLIGEFSAIQTELPINNLGGSPSTLPIKGSVGCTEDGTTYLVI